VEDVYAAIGYGGISLWKIMPKVKDAWQKEHAVTQTVVPAQEKPQVSRKSSAAGVIVDGMDNCLIKFARCCNPLPGDEIIGFITRGFGVSVHKRGCSNVPRNISEAAEPERWVQVHWAGDVREEFKTTLEILASDRSGLLADITQQLFNMHLFIHSLNSRETKDGSAFISATISISNIDQLKNIMSRLSNIQGVQSIRRT
jgi:GTP pyrophosphokinase